MVRFVIAICIFMAGLALAEPNTSPSSAPSPSAGCSTIIYDMVDCVSFLSVGSKDKKPSPSCCSGFETVLNTDPKCICEALKSSAELGIDVDLKRAATLPSACGVSAPPISNCDVSLSPGTAPGAAPGTAPDTAPVAPGTAPDTAPVNPPPPPSDGAPSPSTPEAPADPGTSIIPAPSTDDGDDVVKQAPAPALSGTYSLSACFFVVISMLMVSFSSVSV